VGGVISALDPLMQEKGGIWIAWGSGKADFLCSNSNNEVLVPEDEPRYILKRIPLHDKEIEGYYQGYANRVLWPLFHLFVDKMHMEKHYWPIYREVNKKFAQTAADVAEKEDFIWVQDYHLTLVPSFLREILPNAKIGFFWHIPWPPWEVFGTLPQRKEIMQGLLNCDIIGFHTESYVHNFLGCVRNQLDTSMTIQQDKVVTQDHKTTVRHYPLGISYGEFSHRGQAPLVRKKAQHLRKMYKERDLILGIDRLDYTKGILDRITAFGYFLEQHPEYREKVVLVQIATPSRNDIEEYCEMKKEIDEAVGRINGRFGSEDWTPVTYFYRKISQDLLLAYYQAADIGLLTPLRDGMNLIAKEFAATKEEGGVLILSEFAGAAEQLEEAITVNPYDLPEMAEAIRVAVEMPLEEKHQRFHAMKKKVKQYDASWWLTVFLKDWEQLYDEAPL
jgi:trehalose 6-phosphate synthase/phosphatase